MGERRGEAVGSDSVFARGIFFFLALVLVLVLVLIFFMVRVASRSFKPALVGGLFVGIWTFGSVFVKAARGFTGCGGL